MLRIKSFIKDFKGFFRIILQSTKGLTYYTGLNNLMTHILVLKTVATHYGLDFNHSLQIQYVN